MIQLPIVFSVAALKCCLARKSRQVFFPLENSGKLCLRPDCGYYLHVFYGMYAINIISVSMVPQDWVCIILMQGLLFFILHHGSIVILYF